MNPDGQKLLDLLFEPDEEVCISPDEFGYQSVPLSEIALGSFVLKPQTDKQIMRYATAADVVLVAINPIKGARRDDNVTAYRTFMVELDEGELDEQFKYVKSMKMPYSVCVFSGGKSLHFAITLTESLPSESIWRYYAEWILNIMDRADQQTKNPSRGIRMAGNLRDGKEMRLVDMKTRISREDLVVWLSQYEGFKPQEKRERVIDKDLPPVLEFLPEWVQNELIMGLDTSKGRNNRWFSIAMQCGLQGWDEDATIDLLEQFFQEENDFTRREWLTAVKSGINKAQRKK